MNWRTTAVLFVILAAIVGYLVWDGQREETAVSPPPTTQPLPPTPASVTLISTLPDTITQLTVTNLISDTTVTLVQSEPAVWQQTVPEPAEVISATVNTAVAAFVNLNSSRTLAADENPLSAYGLDAPTHQIETLYQNDDGETVRVTLLVGAATPTGSGYYVQKSGDPRPHIVPMGLINNLTALVDTPPRLEPPSDS